MLNSALLNWDIFAWKPSIGAGAGAERFRLNTEPIEHDNVFSLLLVL